MREITIGKTVIGYEVFEKPYVIAEAGVNHEGELDIALKMIREAAEAGANAVKFQMYKAERLASRKSPAYWDQTKEPATSQYTLFKRYDRFGEEEFSRLAEEATKCGVDTIVTPFDCAAADIVEPLVVAYKVASSDITNTPFLRHVARKQKPIILSTGASNVSEVYQAIEAIRGEGNNDIALLHCVLNYPTAYENANLAAIKTMMSVFPEYVIGYSDHTLPDRMGQVIATAWLMGARIIEKHFTHNKSLPGNDHYHAMDRQDLAELVEHFEFITAIAGSSAITCLPSEEIARQNARRSLVSTRSIERGETNRQEDVVCKRPGTGIPPSFVDYVAGGIALEPIEEDEILQYSKIRLRDGSQVHD